MIGEMRVMDPTGHTSVRWDADVGDEVAAAKAVFDAMTAKGYRAFRTRGLTGNKQGAALSDFDPNAESMILIPQLVGG